MDRWSLITGGIGILSFVVAVYELSSKKKGAAALFLIIGLVFVASVLQNQSITYAPSPFQGTPRSSGRPSGPPDPVAQSSDAVFPVPDLTGPVIAASKRYKLDPDLVNVVIHDKEDANLNPAGSPEKAAQRLRELLERYNFDLIKALAAYYVGTDKVSQCNCVPDEARFYLARVVKTFNAKKLDEGAVLSASAGYALDADLVNIVIHDSGGPSNSPTSPQIAAQRLRELLERYDFDMAKALAAYDRQGEPVRLCAG